MCRSRASCVGCAPARCSVIPKNLHRNMVLAGEQRLEKNESYRATMPGEVSCIGFKVQSGLVEALLFLPDFAYWRLAGCCRWYHHVPWHRRPHDQGDHRAGAFFHEDQGAPTGSSCTALCSWMLSAGAKEPDATCVCCGSLLRGPQGWFMQQLSCWCCSTSCLLFFSLTSSLSHSILHQNLRTCPLHRWWLPPSASTPSGSAAAS